MLQFLGGEDIAIKKFCKCGAVINAFSRHCDDCVHKYKVHETVRQRQYDTLRDKKIKEFYSSAKWVDNRNRVVSKFLNLDIYEYYQNNRIVNATTVHHIIPIKDDFSKRLEFCNLIPVSNATHQHIHAIYEHGNSQDMQKLLKNLLDRFINEFINERND